MGLTAAGQIITIAPPRTTPRAVKNNENCSPIGTKPRGRPLPFELPLTCDKVAASKTIVVTIIYVYVDGETVEEGLMAPSSSPSTPMHSAMGTGTGVGLPVALGVEKEKEHVAPTVNVSVRVKADDLMVDTDMDGEWSAFKFFVGMGNVTVVVLNIVSRTFI